MTTSLTDDALATLTPARVRLGVLTLTCQLPAVQDEVWRWITEPDELARWSPIVPNRSLDGVGEATSRETPDAEEVDATVTEARAPWFLEHRWGPEVITWQLAPSGEGTQLNLVHEPSQSEQIAELAAGWHLCLVVLRRLLAGVETGRCVGQDAVAHGWPHVRDCYAELLKEQLPDGSCGSDA
ncbi:SRPBCC domain-containing protein [Luteococcus sp. H138]|uniref:SRPBCC domain-containing protein n=1 Tax=unclassified Luteococcus TaxID=2639923 RepID=UPI00313E7C44